MNNHLQSNGYVQEIIEFTQHLSGAADRVQPGEK